MDGHSAQLDGPFTCACASYPAFGPIFQAGSEGFDVLIGPARPPKRPQAVQLHEMFPQLRHFSEQQQVNHRLMIVLNEVVNQRRHEALEDDMTSLG